MASKRKLWFKFGRFISGLTIACFFLPFFGVSCDGLDVVTMSGSDMVGGCAPGGMLAEAGKQGKQMGGDDSMGKLDINVDKTPREPLAIVALALAVGVFGAAWMRTRKGMTLAAGMSVACLGALIGLYLKVGGQLKDDIDKYGKGSDPAGEVAKEMRKQTKIEAGARVGLYFTCLSLLAGAVLCGLALKEPEGSENQTA